MFFVEHQCFLVSKNKQLKNHQFLDKRGVATKRLFIKLCFENVKSYRFFAPVFGQILIDVQKNTIK